MCICFTLQQIYLQEPLTLSSNNVSVYLDMVLVETVIRYNYNVYLYEDNTTNP